MQARCELRGGILRHHERVGHLQRGAAAQQQLERAEVRAAIEGGGHYRTGAGYGGGHSDLLS